MLEASMIVIGDEILGGFVADTNSGWLAGRLQTHGIPLSWIHSVPDDVPAIDEALQRELGRSRPRIVVTSGGIGSTPDDLTYEAVAASLGLELVEEPTIAERIRAALEWTREQGVEVSDAFEWHMYRMARVPRGGRLLRHNGWAPGVQVDLDGGVEEGGLAVVILPGVPSQFRAIVSQTLEPELMQGRNDPVEVAELTHGFPESALNLCFADVLERYPGVRLGSYPGVPMLVRITGPSEPVRAAISEVRAYIRALEEDPAGARLAAAWADRMGGAERDRR